MRILSLVAAGVLALAFSTSSWASPAGLGSGGGKAPAAKNCSTKKCSPAADKPKSSTTSKTAKKPGEVNYGSAARQELLKKRLAQSKTDKGKPSAVKKTIKKKS